jgi:hypothetical protein
VPNHTSLKAKDFVTNNNLVIVPHPPYSRDLAPWNMEPLFYKELAAEANKITKLDCY